MHAVLEFGNKISVFCSIFSLLTLQTIYTCIYIAMAAEKFFSFEISAKLISEENKPIHVYTVSIYCFENLLIATQLYVSVQLDTSHFTTV